MGSGCLCVPPSLYGRETEEEEREAEEEEEEKASQAISVRVHVGEQVLRVNRGTSIHLYS